MDIHVISFRYPPPTTDLSGWITPLPEKKKIDSAIERGVSESHFDFLHENSSYLGECDAEAEPPVWYSKERYTDEF